ncbi:MAG TPA: hypothetical protein VN455_01900 [Methanotrichaceae archaeon]|nr:hypothetical protein [Methanotrichaceae archaeon]
MPPQDYTSEDASENIKEAIAGCLESLAVQRMKLMSSLRRIAEVTV